MKIYVAGPLFNEMERERNLEVERWLRRLGFDVHLPQKHGLAAELPAGASPRAARRRIFESDVAALRECDVVLCLLDGPVPDDGMCVELGIAWALGKRCVGYRTDDRRHGRTGDVNPMIEGCLAGIARTRGELAGLLSEAAATPPLAGVSPPRRLHRGEEPRPFVEAEDNARAMVDSARAELAAEGRAARASRAVSKKARAKAKSTVKRTSTRMGVRAQRRN